MAQRELKWGYPFWAEERLKEWGVTVPGEENEEQD